MTPTPVHQLQDLAVHKLHALITGANTGIGRITARELARQGMHLTLAGRSESRTREVMAELARVNPGVRLHFEHLALDDLDSVRNCAQRVLARVEARSDPLDLLVNNAGVAGARGQTRQGFEMAFGVNHLGHFLLTLLLLEHLRSRPVARIVHVASRAHWMAHQIPWEQLRRPTRSLSGIQEYAVSKLCNILFSSALARRVAGTGVMSFSLHPGVVATDIWRSVPALLRPLLRLRPMLSPEEGARTTLHCATLADPSQSGLYFADCQPARCSVLANDRELAERLWMFSASACEVPGFS